MPRVKSPNATEAPLLLAGKEEQFVHNRLPGHMQNQGTRTGANINHEVTMRHLNVSKTNYLDASSTMNIDKA